MKLVYGDLFDVERFSPDALCITTNGFISPKTKRGVMGRGCAKTLSERVKNAPSELATAILKNGHCVQVFSEYKSVPVVSFPVKPAGLLRWSGNSSLLVSHAVKNYKPGDTIPGYHLRATLDVIRKSAEELAILIKEKGWERVILPRPGCGAGELTWDEVGPLLEELLPDSVLCITFKEEDMS